MRFQMLCLTFMAACNSFACTEAMRPYEFECRAQDRYNKLSQEFSNNHITITNIKGFAIPRALGNSRYFSSKNELLIHSETTLAQSKEWQAWKNGQKFLAGYNPVFMEYSDVLKLHKVMFNGIAEAGKIRTSFGVTNPKTHYSCNDQVINDQVSALLDNYDVKSSEGYPLITLENLTRCEDQKNYSADLVFYKGASMKTELKSWLADFNDMLNRYSTENQKPQTTPYDFLSDMRRWFLAIHPFTSGNEALVNVLMDIAAKQLLLPPLSTSGSNSVLIDINDNRLENLNAIQESLSFFESCLYETKVNLVSPQCRSI